MINVSLLDFGPQQRSTGANQRDCSRKYGHIVEKPARVNVPICGDQEERNTVIYQSVSNAVEVYLEDGIENDVDQVLIGFTGTLAFADEIVMMN